jgi:hypothetical protein
MVYEWGTKLPYATKDVPKDYVVKKDDVMGYYGEYVYKTLTGVNILDFEKDVVIRLADKTKAEGQEPIYVRCEVTNFYMEALNYVYEYNTEMQVKILKASPIPWGVIIGIILVAIAIYILTISIEKFWKVIAEIGEALATALGLPAGMGVALIVMTIVGIAIAVIVGIMGLVRR